MIERINALYSVRTVSGSEHLLTDFIKNRLSDVCDEISCDSIGNIYALKRGYGKLPRKTVAILCACDEPGFVATYVDENGKIRLHGTGGKNYGSFAGMYAESYDGTRGILLSDISDTSKIGADDLYLDIGAECASDVDIKEGDFIALSAPPSALGKNKLSLGIMGQKAFADTVISVAKSAGNYSFDVCCIFASQHLLGAKGEKCAAYTANADILIAVTGISNDKLSCGSGAALCVCDGGGRCSRSILKDLNNTAQSIGVKVFTHAEASKEIPSLISPFIASGTKTAIIGIPIEKPLCGANICDRRDISCAAALASAFLIFEDEKEDDRNE